MTEQRAHKHRIRLNPYEIIRKYECSDCSGVMMCACDKDVGRADLGRQLDYGLCDRVLGGSRAILLVDGAANLKQHSSVSSLTQFRFEPDNIGAGLIDAYAAFTGNLSDAANVKV